MNFFIEGLQGSGKSTLSSALARRFPGYAALEEGVYSPIELAWCAYMGEEDFRAALERYPALRPQIEAQTVKEGGRFVVCYTKVKTEDRDFYRDMEKYEIYNGRLPGDAFRALVLERFAAWRGDGMIFECSLFQNIVEELLLYACASDGEVLDFYKKVRAALTGRPMRILYLEAQDVPASIDAVRRERVDGEGNQVWFSMLLEFFDASPFARANGVRGEEALLRHLERRQALELRICREIFLDCSTVLTSKGYTEKDLDALVK